MSDVLLRSTTMLEKCRLCRVLKKSLICLGLGGDCVELDATISQYISSVVIQELNSLQEEIYSHVFYIPVSSSAPPAHQRSKFQGGDYSSSKIKEARHNLVASFSVQRRLLRAKPLCVSETTLTPSVVTCSEQPPFFWGHPIT